MGGCRCSFRDCANTTSNSPGMHFFHYPLKDRERCLKWIEYADTKSILSLPMSKARNKVICETHFKDDCFMNYKKDRLVHSAVPTIVRLSKDCCLDFEESNNPQIKVIPPPSKSHLIPPVELNKIINQKRSIESTECKNLENATLNLNGRCFGLNDAPAPAKIKKITPKILNPCLRQSKKVDENILICGDESMDIFEKDNSNLIVFENCDTYDNKETLRIIDFNILVNSQNNYIEEIIEVTKNEDLNSENQINNVNNFLEEEKYVVNEEICDENVNNDIGVTEQQNDDNKNSQLRITIPQLEKKINDLQAQLAEEKNKNIVKLKENCKSQAEATSTSNPTATITASPLTKVQLFNNIKRYLGASLATLVRMEMFGGPDREWKSDEKQLSVELLQLGENVFKYMRDEWRFRLPALKDVEKWVNECENEENDECS